MALNPETVFTQASQSNASDVHIAVGAPLIFRIDGQLVPQGSDILSESDVESFVKGVVNESAYKNLQAKREIDASYSLKDGVRLRINCLYERGSLGLVARVVPATIPTLDQLDLTEIANHCCNLNEGLVLLTGPTGTGKSTSLASMLQAINQERAEHIITIEDPIEFIFPKGKGLIRQRECGSDFLTFPEALKHILRQDPDIVMVGEMRDLETIAAALTMAETGHLVFATLHTPNAVQTIDRIVDVFPPHQQNQIRSQLSLSLKAIVAQRLIPGVDGSRIAQREVLLTNPAVSNIIRDNRLQELRSVLQTNVEMGMKTFEMDAKRLLEQKKITEEVFEWAKLEG